jgi:hypothetical protein
MDLASADHHISPSATEVGCIGALGVPRGRKAIIGLLRMLHQKCFSSVIALALRRRQMISGT